MPTPHHRFPATWLAAAVGGGCILGAAALHAQEAAATAPATQVPAGEPAETPHPLPAPANGPLQPGALMDRAASNAAQIYVDDSFASVEKLREANRYAAQGQSQLAINAYQKVINEFGQKLVYLDNDSYLSVTDYVRQKLLDMPAVQSGMYDQLLGLEAQKEIEPLVAQRDTAGVLRACDRYFPSTAALNGLSQAAEWYFERSDFSAAARLWQELLHHPAARAPEKRAQFLFRAAVAQHMDRNDSAARALFEQLQKEFPDASGTVDGQSVNLVEKLDALLHVPAADWAQEVPRDEWPQFQGGPTHAALPDANASIGAQLWNIELRPQAANPAIRAMPPLPNGMIQVQSGEPRPQTPSRLISYPVLSEGTLFIHTGDRILALSSNAGTPVWAFPQREPTRAESMREQLYQARMEGDNPYRPSAHQSVAVWGNRVYAVLPATPAANSSDDNEESVLIPGSRIVCLDRNSGAEKWSTPSRNIKLDSKGTLAFIGSPLLTRRGVFVMARKTGDTAFVQLYIVRLDPDTGAPAWSCYICSATGGAYYAPMMNFASIPIPTFSDDMLYVSTGQGADCAIDANAGRIRWLQVTEAAKKNRSPQDYFNPSAFVPSWKLNPPLVHGDRLITCETSGPETILHLYDRWNGKLLRSISNKDLQIPRIDAMVGLIGSRVILTGSSCAALDIDTADQSPTPAWTSQMPAAQETGPAEGRPFLAASALYVPCEKGMQRFDPATGKSLDFWQWPRTQKDLPGKPGNLLVTSEQVVVVNDTDVSGYSRWETARDNRLAQIKAHPQSPEPYLALGEIAFRTNHLDLAEENTRRAVELAAAAPDSEDILGRLYRTSLNFAEQLLGKSESDLRDRARFYFEQCKATARSPEQQAEWRLSMSDLSLAQDKPEEAALLYSQVLTDAAMRAAPFHRGDAVSRAGVTAEQKFRALLDKTPAVYRRFEDQAAALLAKAQSQQDLGMMQQVVDSYPNSNAAVTAATQLVNTYRDRQDWASDLRVLRWLYRHAPDAIKGRVTADLAIAQLGLKRYGAALAWAERGLRQYPDLSWHNASGPTTFASLRDQVHAARKNLSEGRRPTMPAPQNDEGPAMDAASLSRIFLANATLLPPVERSANLNRPDLLFAAVNDNVHLFDVPSGKELTTADGIQMPEHAPATLLGSWGNISVLVQSHTLVGINTTTHAIAWQIPLSPSGNNEPRPSMPPAVRIRVIQQPGGGQIIMRGNGRLMINGQIVSGIDAQMDPAMAAGAADPEIARQIAFAKLGQLAFSTVRMIDDKLLVATSSGISAFSVDNGKPAWRDPNGEPLLVKTPGGLTSTLVGNDDLVVAQVDPQDHAGSSFLVLDAETGKFRKQIKLDNEHALWRTISDDGTLFTVTELSVAAYDLFSDQDKPLWRRPDIQSRFPYATILTLDGLILVNRNSDVLCLAQDGGETRWPKPPMVGIRLDTPEQSEIAYERSLLDGDIVIFQSNGIFSGYATEVRSSGDQLVYRGTVPPEAPPLQDMQLSDRYLICLANGSSVGSPRAVELLLYDRAKTALLVTQVNVPNDSGVVGDGPILHSWQVLDNAIALEINGNIRLFRAKKPS
ncbi:MAG: outer membrane protein assembly factor BamB family protein [Phycisphaerae bacterium]